ncbi:hypothetical protein [Pelagicoccus sp. SDUM812003]|uniref:hypothetical protein n=1 Tax=Pelagicoccus sp. SDUM812003 TaxID=3041267 RepID=UPI00280FEC54|nr:hypothetical protein [Pelagicoccus sp. SDUM812003]MDQ8203057.1 hypothetical protein [Pelagicoccus sp. SDUM812003]
MRKTKQRHPTHSQQTNARRWLYLSLSAAFLGIGLVAGAALYPGPYDWQYTVVSALASSKHNPQGGVWFSSALAVSFGFLWPFVSSIQTQAGSAPRLARIAKISLRVGIVCGVLMGIESISTSVLPERWEKTHEALALFSFLSFYLGLLALSSSLASKSKPALIAALAIALPLLCIGASQLALYLDQRDLGWVDQSWRDLGVPLWKSFAFWQWIAFLSLWPSLAVLGASRFAEPPMTPPLCQSCGDPLAEANRRFGFCDRCATESSSACCSIDRSFGPD